MPTLVRTAPLTVAILALGFLAGCPDTQARFEEFEGRVIDAAPSEMIDAPPLEEIPDISGSYYVAFATYDPLPESVIHFIWDVEMQPKPSGLPTVTVSVAALNAETRVKVPGLTVLADMQVNSAGEFMLVFDNYVLPAAADPLGLGDLILVMQINATIKGEHSFCGVVVDGTANGTAALDGTTFGALHIVAGTEGAALPPPLTVCPEPALPDGGLPDAGGLDAGTDANATDANVTDAGQPDV